MLEKQYNIIDMYRVTRFDKQDLSIVLFESYEDAEEYKTMLEKKGVRISLNVFQWEVKIED